MSSSALHPSTGSSSAALPPLDGQTLRGDFPILSQQVHGKDLVYLDNAATTQKPRAVIEAITDYYCRYNANVHRGVHSLSQDATEAFEQARAKIQRFLGAARSSEIIFVRGATEAINLVASSYAAAFIPAGSQVIISALEHHSNIVPWQIFCQQKQAVLRVIPMNDLGELDLDEYRRFLQQGPVGLVALVHVSNALGTINPAKEMTALAHERGAVVLLDGAQAAPHMAVDVQDLDCDFYAVSGHKMLGPTGIGVLYGKLRLLEKMPPYQAGGDMIKSVRFEKTIYNDLPYKFEAGTPDIAGAIGLGAAVDYLQQVGMARICAYEQELLAYGASLLEAIPQVRQVGQATQKAAVLSFLVEGIHPHDVGTILDQEGVAIRTGHHCAQPVMERLGIAATARASLALYNTRADLDALARAIAKVIEVFQ